MSKLDYPRKFEYPKRDFGKDDAEKEKMSDMLKAPGAHSMIYEKRPGLYPGGIIPAYPNAEEIEEPAFAIPAEEHIEDAAATEHEEVTDLDGIVISEIADAVRGMETVELDAAIESELADRSVVESARNGQAERVHAVLEDMEE